MELELEQEKAGSERTRVREEDESERGGVMMTPQIGRCGYGMISQESEKIVEG